MQIAVHYEMTSVWVSGDHIKDLPIQQTHTYRYNSRPFDFQWDKPQNKHVNEKPFI